MATMQVPRGYARMSLQDIDQKSINAVVWSECVYAEYISTALHGQHHINRRQTMPMGGVCS